MYSVNNLDSLDKNIWNNRDKIIMLYFGASWCGPCEQLKSRLCDDNYMKEMPLLHVIYLDIDLEELKEINEKYSISSLPTQILILLDTNKIVELDRIEGYDWIKLKMLYTKIANLIDDNNHTNLR